MKPGKNRIERRSIEAAVTIPFEQTYPTVTADEDGRSAAVRELPIFMSSQSLTCDIVII